MSSFPVYAPTSHPLPVISPASTQAFDKGILSILNVIKLPLSFQRESDKTLLLLRENRCGIDGLRNGAVPDFSNIWLEDSGSWGLRGVHPVSSNMCVGVWTHDVFRSSVRFLSLCIHTAPLHPGRMPYPLFHPLMLTFKILSLVSSKALSGAASRLLPEHCSTTCSGVLGKLLGWNVI